MRTPRALAALLIAAAFLICTSQAFATTITEYSNGISAGSAPTGVTAGPDGNTWVTELNGDRVARVTPSGAITEFSTGITPNSGPSGITAGPDGNLWFTEVYASRIARITPSGTVTEFSTGITPNSYPAVITAGPDGNLWFTENNSDKIGRITPSGTVTEFSSGISPGAHPIGITTGPDGNLWFTESGTDKIGRITPSGTVTEFGGLTSSSLPAEITAGPDGNLWFTEGNSDKVGRMTPSGTITEFSSGITSGAAPEGITSGADGNLWFTEFNGDRVARITPSGTVTEFSSGITPGSNPAEIASGPDGNLWFTEQTGDRVARIAFDEPPSAATGDATNVTTSSATVNGLVNPQGAPTTVSFDYGTTSAYGSSAAAGSLPAGGSAKPVSAQLSGLPAGTVVHYRVVATNQYGTTAGADRVLTTAAQGSSPGGGGAGTPTVTAPRPVARGPRVVFGALKRSRNGILERATCRAPVHEACHITVALFGHERVQHGRVMAVVAAGGRRVRDGRRTFTLTRGQSRWLRVGLNSRGRTLLTRFHRLPLRVQNRVARPGLKPAVSTRRVTLARRR